MTNAKISKIRVKAPAKINLTLKVQKKRSDGFHPIESVMAAINLYDFIDIEIIKNCLYRDMHAMAKADDRYDSMACKNCGHGLEGYGFKIKVSSNSSEIPNNSSNIAYKACELFLQNLSFQNLPPGQNFCSMINIYIEKNSPVCAGLAGGSTDACGVIYGLNKIFGNPYGDSQIDSMLSKLGSDLNFCMVGGTKLCKGRGEILIDTEFQSMPITLIKPLNLKISAKEAYQRFDELGDEISKLNNDLEFALLPYYEELRFLNSLGFQMSGSGPVFFAKERFLDANVKKKLQKDYVIIENLKTVNSGVEEVFD